MTVYVVQEPRPFRDRATGAMRSPDISGAAQFGSIRFVFDKSDDPSIMPGHAMVKARKALKDFNDDDVLLWAGGDPAGLAMCSMLAGSVNSGRIKMLRWERTDPRVFKTNPDADRGYYTSVEVRV